MYHRSDIFKRTSHFHSDKVAKTKYAQLSKPVFAALLKKYLSVIANRNVIIGAIFVVGVWGAYGFAVYWVPTILMEEQGWSAGLAGFIGASFPLAGMILCDYFWINIRSNG